MRFDREALDGGLTVFSTVKHQKAELEFTAYLDCAEDSGPAFGEAPVVELSMTDREGREVACACIPAREICSVRSLLIYPHLWNGTADPYLYRVKASLMRGEETLDQIETVHAVRTLGEKPLKGFLLNDKTMDLRAVRYRTPPQLLGNALYLDTLRRDLQALLELGANTVCPAEPPRDPYFYRLCDELGILIWKEYGGSASVPELAGEGGEGLLTPDRRHRRDRYYYYKACWSGEPFVHLCGRLDCRRAGEVTQVCVYSNQKKAALYVDGVLFEFKEGPPDFIFEEVPLKGPETVISVQAGECFASMTLQRCACFS